MRPTPVVSMGTATLEAALLGLPHVACYRVSGTTYSLARRLVKIPHFALPNLIAGEEIVPELLQGRVTGEKLAQAVLPMLEAGRREADADPTGRGPGRTGRRRRRRQSGRHYLGRARSRTAG